MGTEAGTFWTPKGTNKKRMTTMTTLKMKTLQKKVLDQILTNLMTVKMTILAMMPRPMTFRGIWILMNLRAKTGLIWSEKPPRMMMKMKTKDAVEIADRRPEIKNIETENVANIRVATLEEVMVGVRRNPAQGITRVQAKVIIKAATATEVALKVITTKIVTEINENMVQAVVLVNTI